MCLEVKGRVEGQGHDVARLDVDVPYTLRVVWVTVGEVRTVEEPIVTVEQTPTR